MLREISTLKGMTVGALDGEIGSVYDVYFDAQHWTVRYFVVDTGTWLSGRRVVISPLSLKSPADVAGDRLNVGLTKAQIEQAPSWDTAKPVSRQHEIAYARYYDYPYYWTGPARWGIGWDPLTGVPPVPVRIPSRRRYSRGSERAPTSTSRVLATSSATTCRPRTTTWVTWRTSSSTTGPGPSVTSWSTRGTGFRAAGS